MLKPSTFCVRLCKAVSLDGKQPLYYANLAAGFEKVGNLPKSLDSLLKLGLLHQTAQDFDAAIPVYQTILSKDPARYGALVNMATPYATQRGSRKAVAFLLAGIELCAAVWPEVKLFIQQVVPVVMAAGIIPSAPTVLPPTGALGSIFKDLPCLHICAADFPVERSHNHHTSRLAFFIIRRY